MSYYAELVGSYAIASERGVKKLKVSASMPGFIKITWKLAHLTHTDKQAQKQTQTRYNAV